MKLTKTALLKKKPDLFGSPDRVFAEFQDYYDREKATVPSNLILLYADYTYEDYSGDAYVLGYNKDKKQFFEVHGSHCSCYGLEGQWDEEYYDDVKQLQASIERRFKNRSEYSRYAYNSHEFEKWLEEE